MGPDEMHLPSRRCRRLVHDGKYDFGKGMRTMLMHFYFIEYITSQRVEKTEYDDEVEYSRAVSASLDGDFSDNELRACTMRYIDSFVHRASGLEKRSEACLWLLQRCPQLSAFLTPEQFVLCGQLHLLKWAVDAGIVDLNAAVSNSVDNSTRKYALELGLKIDEIHSAALMSKLLALTAAAPGELPILEWLLQKSFKGRFTVALFKVSVMLNQYAVVNFCAARLDSDFEELRWYLIELLMERDPLLSLEIAEYIRTSSCCNSSKLGEWSEVEFLRAVFLVVSQLLAANAPLDDLLPALEEFTIEQDFWHESFIRFLTNLVKNCQEASGEYKSCSSSDELFVTLMMDAIDTSREDVLKRIQIQLQ